MDSMYDKLGELLSDALDSGFIPQKNQKSEEKKSDSQKSQEEVKTDKAQEQNSNPSKNSDEQNSKQKNPQYDSASVKKSDSQKFGQSEQKDTEIIKFLPENVKTAFAQIKIPENATFDEAKKIYREKLKYYHPDTKNDNPVLQKVAKEKTENLLSNWKIVEEYFKSQKLK